MNRILSIILSLTMMVSLSTNAFAIDALPEDAEVRLQAIIDQIRTEIPSAEIRVIDTTLHIVVKDLSTIPEFKRTVSPYATTTTTVYSSNGGSYRGFAVPWFADYFPYSQVYMNKDVVDALKLQMTEPKFCKWVVEQLSVGLTTTAVAALAESVYGIIVSAGVISVIGSFLYWVTTNLEYWSLKSAQSSSTTGKVSVIRGTNYDGYYSFVYLPWNDNICTTYGGYDATWYEGIYDV